MSNPRRKIRIWFVVLIALALLGYGLWQSKKLIVGPQITILEPQDGATVSTDLVTIKGVAKNIAYIKLDDNPIFVNDQGEFSEELLVPEGYSVIKVTVEDKFGKVRERLIHVVLPKSSVSTASSSPSGVVATSTASTTIISQPTQ